MGGGALSGGDVRLLEREGEWLLVVVVVMLALLGLEKVRVLVDFRERRQVRLVGGRCHVYRV